MALARGSAIALNDAGRDVSYAELLEQIDHCAGQLAALGVQPGDRVLVALPNCVDYVAAVAGAWQAGAVVVPLHPQSSPREIERVVADCSPTLAVSTGSLLDILSRGSACRVLAADELASGSPPPQDLSGLASQTVCDPSSLAMILYTSGTTGRPKGVMLRHASLVANFQAIVAALKLSAADSTLQVLPACYAYGNSVLWTHLLAGARVALARDFVFWSRTLDALRSQRVSGFYGVPATFALLVNHSDLFDREWPDLRYLACAGGALPTATVQKLRTGLPHLRLHLMYGQTEATARLSVLPAEEVDARPKSIGRGLDGVELSVRDEAGHVVGPAVVGHLVAQGPNVMQGYWNDSVETAHVLRSTGLWTGDLAYTDEDGFVYVVGRAGERIKFGSHRIHPAEIEEALFEHPAVAEAAVTGVPDDIFGEAPLACVALAADAQALPADLLQFLAVRLPRHKLPRHIRIVERLPKTTAGKIDRTALCAQFFVAQSAADVEIGR